MKKKKLLLVLAVIVILTVSGTVIALASNTNTVDNIKSFFGVSTANLTAQQKADINDSISQMAQQQKENAQKMADLQKQAINKMVADGAMTKVQGDAAIKKIDDQLAKMEQNGSYKGWGIGMGEGSFGFQGNNKLDLSKLTDAQKADLKTSLSSIADTEKQAVEKMAADGAITKDQGDAASKNIDNMVNNFDNNGTLPGLLMGKSLFTPWNIKGIDASKLTDQQKTDLKGYITQITGLQKEAINKLVADGVITQDQGNAAVKRIDGMVSNINTNGFPSGKGMGNGKFQGGRSRGNMMNTNQNNTSLQ